MRLLLSFALATLLLPTPSAFGQGASGKSAIKQPPFRSGLSGPVSYFIGADGVRLAYRKLGRGKHVVVCIHGGPGLSMASGCADAEPLAKGATFIMYDQRGSGRSELVTDPRLLTATSHVRDLEALREHFRISRMTLIGFSWGAGVVGLYAISHPERVERLLLVAPLPPAKTPYWEQRLAKINEKLGSEVAARMAEIRRRIPEADDAETLALCRALRVGYRAYLYNPSNLSRVRDRCDVSPASIRNGIIVARATLDSLGDWDFRPQLAKLKMPVLVIEGAQTEVPLEATRDWVATIPNARLFLIPNAGHELWAEQPTTFIMAAEQFLSGKYPKRSERVVNRATTSPEDEKNSKRAEKLALGPCEDTNVNFFLPVMEAQALLPIAVGSPVMTPLFGGNTTPLNVAHFHCAKASIGGRPPAAINFVLIRFGLKTGGHYVVHIMTDSGEFQHALDSFGVTSHLVRDVSLNIEGAMWTTKWGGNFSPYSVSPHQVNRLPTSSGRIDWIFRGTNGLVSITGSYTLTEEFGDRNPNVSVPEESVLRAFFNQSRGVTALTHRMSLDLTLLPKQ